jgi:type IV pilus assembly protein PilE
MNTTLALPATQSRCRGFTLIEVMVATAITGVLSGIAYPSFMGTVHKVRRADAQVAMLQVQAAQERWRGMQGSYGSLAEIRQPATSPAGHYTLLVRAQDGAGYEVLATASGAQAGDRACRHLLLRVAGMNASQSSGADLQLANDTETNRRCWNL